MEKQQNLFKQYFFFFAFFFFAITLTAQGDNKNFKVSDITGTYIGYQQSLVGKKDKTKQWKIILNDKMNFSLFQMIGDLWVEQVNAKGTRKKFYKKKGSVYYEFNAFDKKDIKSFSISILSERYKKLSNTDGLFIIVSFSDGNRMLFDMNREGGNPKMPRAKKPANTTSSSKQENQKIIQYIENARWQMGSFDKSRDYINERIRTFGERQSKMTHADMQSYLTNIVNKFEGLKVGAEAGIKELENAIAEAKSVECKEIQSDLEKAKNSLSVARDEFLYAMESTREMGYAKKATDKNKHANESTTHYRNGFKNYRSCLSRLEAAMLFYTCFKTSEGPIINRYSGSSNNNTWQIKPNLVSGVKVGLKCDRSYGKIFLAEEIKPGWAAAKAGIRKGDEILEINGVVVKGMIELDMDLLFLGKAGTSVKVKVKKKYDPTPHTYHMIRGEGGSFTEEKIIVVEDEMPAFSGNYEGDNLLKLFGRDVKDKAIKKWLSMNNFKRDKNCSYENYCGYTSGDKGISINFKKRKLVTIRFWYSEDRYRGKFLKKTPLNIPLGKPHAVMNSFGKDWETYGECFWKKKQNNIMFRVAGEVFGEKGRGIVEYITMVTDEDIDWKAYHQSFDYSTSANVEEVSTPEKVSAPEGDYAGDNLLKLLGKDINDPAIVKWIENPEFGFAPSKYLKCNDNNCVYISMKYGINLNFDNKKLTRFSFFKHRQNYNIRTPLDVLVGKALTNFNPKSKGFIQATGLRTNSWKKEGIKFIYTIDTDINTNTIKRFTIFNE